MTLLNKRYLKPNTQIILTNIDKNDNATVPVLSSFKIFPAIPVIQNKYLDPRRTEDRSQSI